MCALSGEPCVVSPRELVFRDVSLKGFWLARWFRTTAQPKQLALLTELAEPLLSTTLQLPDDLYPLNDADEIRDRLGKRIELILDAGPCGMEPSTVVDLTGDLPVVLRKGKGPIARLGLPIED